MSEVGKNLPHDSAVGHVTGASVYIDDMPPAHNELLVDVFYSPVSHGIIESLDLTKARSISGVVAIFTYKDLDGKKRLGPIIQDEVLLVEKVCEFMGHPIAVIAAENRKALKKAKAAINCKIKELEPVLSIDAAKAKNQFLATNKRLKRGDAEKAFSQAENILEGKIISAGQDHFYFESQAAIAYPGEHNQIVVHSSTQSPSEVQHSVAHFLGLQQNQVVCITKRVGGGFGGKECQATHFAIMASLVALKTKRPARIILDKDTDMQITGKRHPFETNYKVAFTAEGLITGLKVNLYADGGAFHDLSLAVISKCLLHVDNAYYIPDLEFIGNICKTNYPPTTAFRGFGSPQGVLAIENIIEDIAHFLNKDAYEIRKLNCYGIEERNITPYGQTIENNTLARLFNELFQSSKYSERKKQIEEFNTKSQTHLKGISLMPVKFGVSFSQTTLNQASALVNIYTDGSIQVSTGATEIGQGVNTHIKQLVADEFDILANKVIVMPTSTEKNNNISATAASSATDLNGSAAVEACRKIKERLVACASEYFASQNKSSFSPENIVFKDGRIIDNRYSKNCEISFEELVQIAFTKRISLGERGFYATPKLQFNWESGPEKIGQGQPYSYFTNGCAVAEVLIDKFTGATLVSQVDILMDIGNPINPGIARGQIVGAYIQGMGWVTTEELKYDEKGMLLSHSPTTYKIPNIQDLPHAFTVAWIDNENLANIKGSKAIGEPPLLLGISVWTAIKHALSFISKEKTIDLKLPATNEEILMFISRHGLKEQESKAIKEQAVVSTGQN
jgi:xanthine dehydrogenase large subunit